MPYSIKEIQYTIHGEGALAGRVAVFCRFAGCNLWTGSEEDRPEAVCDFCDTQFVGTDGPGGGEFDTAEQLAAAIDRAWRGETAKNGNVKIDAVPNGAKLVVCTGGEPLMQFDALLADAFHQHGFEIALETNGTRRAPHGIDWLTVSPKAGAALKVKSGDELKLVYPQPGIDPQSLTPLDFRHFFLQPMDGPQVETNTRLCIEYCLEHPLWRLSVQRHKILGLP